MQLHLTVEIVDLDVQRRPRQLVDGKERPYGERTKGLNEPSVIQHQNRVLSGASIRSSVRPS
jgi:hypothetical protein